jgi:hypothetical protein
MPWTSYLADSYGMFNYISRDVGIDERLVVLHNGDVGCTSYKINAVFAVLFT